MSFALAVYALVTTVLLGLGCWYMHDLSYVAKKYGGAPATLRCFMPRWMQSPRFHILALAGLAGLLAAPVVGWCSAGLTGAVVLTGSLLVSGRIAGFAIRYVRDALVRHLSRQ
jgi:hypothetical protein